MPRKPRPSIRPTPGLPAGLCAPCWTEGKRSRAEDYQLPARRPLPWWPGPATGSYRIPLCDQHWMSAVEEGIGLLRSEPDRPLAPRYSTTPAGQCAECWYNYRPTTPGEAVRVRGRVVRLCQACQREVQAGGWAVTSP